MAKISPKALVAYIKEKFLGSKANHEGHQQKQARRLHTTMTLGVSFSSDKGVSLRTLAKKREAFQSTTNAIEQVVLLYSFLVSTCKH